MTISKLYLQRNLFRSGVVKVPIQVMEVEEAGVEETPEEWTRPLSKFLFWPQRDTLHKKYASEL